VLKFLPAISLNNKCWFRYYLIVHAAIFNLQIQNRTILKLLKSSESVVTCNKNTVPATVLQTCTIRYIFSSVVPKMVPETSTINVPNVIQ